MINDSQSFMASFTPLPSPTLRMNYPRSFSIGWGIQSSKVWPKCPNNIKHKKIMTVTTMLIQPEMERDAFLPQARVKMAKVETKRSKSDNVMNV